MTETLVIEYGRITGWDFFSSTDNARTVDPSTIVRENTISLGVDNEMREIENAAIWDFWKFEDMD